MIYLFNVFIIPYYNFKYVVNIKNIKKNMIIYVILSMVAVAIGIIFPLSSKENIKINRFESLNKETEFILYGNYVKRDDTNYDMYASDYSRSIHIGAFVNKQNDATATSEYILDYREKWLFSTRENVRLIESKENELEDKIISSKIYYGEKDINKSIYKISTITYKNSNYIIDTIQTIYYEDYDELKAELEQILVDVRILK